LTDGKGVDSAIEALGSARTFADCVRVTRPGGTISNVGYHGEGDVVPIPRVEWGVGMADKTIRTGLCPGGRTRLERLLRLLSTKRVDPTPLTSHRLPFGEVEKGFQMMAKKQDGVLKPLILFG
jgi:isopropanol dehydrogenase (NADP+)